MNKAAVARLIVTAMAFMAASGCASVPFEAHKRVDVGHMDPEVLVRSYSSALPQRFNLLSSLVFRYTFIGKVGALGTLEADRKERRFSVAGMSPLGVKLFSVEADSEGITERFVMPPLDKKGDLAAAVAGDIWRMYFDLFPSEDARVRKHKRSIEFIESTGDGFLVYVFAGPEGLLITKKFYKHGVLRWKVGYYEYIREGDRLYPGGIVLTDRVSGYELTARLKKVYDKKN